MKIGFIGAGKVGISFAKFLCNNGLEISGFYNRTKAHVKKAVDFTQTKEYTTPDKLVVDSDVIFITVSDDAIEEVLNNSIDTLDELSSKAFVHMSGAHSSIILKAAYIKGATVYSLHPLQSVSDIEMAVEQFSKSYFSIESYNGEIGEHLEEILDKLSHWFEISTEHKPIYHMAACVFSNYLVTLMSFGLDLMDSIGVSEKEAFSAMTPLIMGTLSNIQANGINESLTGPLSRGDKETIKMHLETYRMHNKKYEVLYRVLGSNTLDFVLKNNYLDDLKVSELKELLRGEQHEEDNS